MSTQAPSRDARLVEADVYAPDFQVEIEGQKLDPAVKWDVIDLRVNMRLDELAGFTMRVANLDAEPITESKRFKYSDGPVFDLGSQAKVSIGYAGRLRLMVTGLITRMSPTFPATGIPTLEVSGLDGLMLLRDSKPKDGERGPWRDKQDWQIAEKIAQRHKMKLEAPVKSGPTHKQVLQRDQDDAIFLLERAKRIDYDCYVRLDGNGKATLYFGPPTDGRDGAPIKVYRLVWGESLVSFSPTLTVARQVASVTVRGWDPATKSSIVETAKESDLPKGRGPRGRSGPGIVGERFGDKREVVVNTPVQSTREAKELAKAILVERASSFVEASGEVAGLPDLRPDDNLEIAGLGTRFSTTYHVTSVGHSIGEGGYRTTFTCRAWFEGRAR